MGASLVGPMIIGLLPFLFGWGVCLLSSLYTRAYDPPACDACGKMVVKTFAPVIRSRPLASTQGDLAA
jgi:hypothetical protein